MAFDYTGLFTALGAICGRVAEINEYRSTTAPAGAAAIEAACDAVAPGLDDNLYGSLLGHQNALGGYLSYLRTVARNTLIRAVADFEPQPDNSLSTALARLIAAMRADGQGVAANAVGASLAAGGSNVSNPRIVVSTRTRTGKVQENLLAESIALTVAADAQSGGVTAGNELVSVRGRQAVGDPLSWLWPGGSGAGTTLVGVDPLTQDGRTGTANALTDGSFEDWAGSPAAPVSWAVRTGTAGTDVLPSYGVFYDGAACLSFAGDGATLSAVDQAVTALPLEVLHLCCWVKVDSAPAAGVLQVALVDGSGVVVADGEGTANAVTCNLVAVGSTFTPVYTTFRTPAVLPPTLRLRVRLSTALTAGRTAYVDKLSLARPVLLAPQNLYLSCHSGNVPMIAGDSWTVTTTNTRSGLFQTYFERLFGMRALGLLLPSSGSPTIPDSLIT